MKKIFLALLFLGVCGHANAQAWPYFPPPGMSYDYTTENFALGSITSGLTPYRYLVDGNSSDMTDGHASANFQNAILNGSVLEFALAPDSLTPQTTGIGDFLDVWRSAIANECEPGTTLNAYTPCRITLGMGTGVYGGINPSGCQEIIGPQNPPSAGASNPKDLGFRLRCFDNDSAGLLWGSHASGTQAYGWGYMAYSGNGPNTRDGLGLETLPVGTTGATGALRMPHCKGAQDAVFTGYITIGGILNISTLSSGTISVGQTVYINNAIPNGYLIASSAGVNQWNLTQTCQSNCGTVGSPVSGSTFDDITPPYECLTTSPGDFIFQISDGDGNASDLGGPLNGTTFLKVLKTVSVQEARITLGDSATSTSSTNIVGGSTANTQANGSPIVTLASGGNITTPPTINSQGICLANGTNCPAATPGGSSGQMQYNNGGLLGGDAGLKTNGAGAETIGTTGSVAASITGAQISGTGNASTLIITGQNGGTTSGASGAITLQTATPVEGNSGNVLLTSGNASTTGSTAHNSGSMTVRTGTPTGTGASGLITFSTGNSTTGGNTGAWSGGSGQETNGTSGNTGNVTLSSGTSTAGNSGNVTIAVGSAGGTSGTLNLSLNGQVNTQFTANSHHNFQGTVPTVSACGTGPSIDSFASDTSGTVTVGTVAAASCTITFASAYTTWNHCRVTSQGIVASLAYSYTLSAITVTGTSLVGDLLDYDCDGK